MNPFNYEKLEIARLLRQRTQKDVVKDVGISQSTLSKAEHGLLELSDDMMQKLCQYYDMPIEFFSEMYEVPPAGYLYYRRKLTITNKIIDSFVAKVQIFKAIIDSLMQSVELPDYALDNYRPSEDLSPKEIAHKIRFSLKVFHGPVPNLSTLLENNGIVIVRFDFGTEKIDGVSAITNENRKVMFINSQMPDDRIRFSMAHELGHIVMHIANPPKSSEEAEREADEFATEFLMPELEIRPMLENLTIPTLASLKRRWRVSMHALVRRAKDLGVINSQQYRNMQIYFSKKGYTKTEPIQLPIEQPTILKETLRLYRDELGYSDQDLMSIMHINKNDFVEWFAPRPKIIRFQPIFNKRI